jgi:tetratricopeptide (TPR) repeat protein
MREGVFRKGLAVLLISCGLIVVCSYALMAHLALRRNYPGDLSKGSLARPATRSAQALIAARKELNEGQVEQALVNFREALSLNPQSLAAQLGLAEGEYTAGREEIAAKEYWRALQLDNQNRSALLALARIHSHHAQTWPQAASDYRNYLKQNPGDAHASLGLARVLAWQGRSAEAAMLFERSDVAPLMTDVDQRDYAFALIKMKRDTQAVAVLRTQLAKRPGDSELSLQLADIYAAHRSWSAALPIYRDLLAKRSGDPSLNLSYGLDLLATGHYQAALEPLDRARTAMPANGEAGLAYARAMKGTGNLKKAVKEYERVLPRFEGDTSVVREYADVLLEEKDYQKSARYYGIAYNQGLRDDRLLAGYAGSLSGAGKYKEALPYLEELRRRNAAPTVTLKLARVLAWQGRAAEAAMLFERSDVAPLMTDVDQRDYAFALIKMKRDTQAVAVLRTLLAKRPGDSELSLQLAGIYASQRNWNAALPIYRDLLAERPGDPSLNLSYGLSLVASEHYQAALEPLEKARTAMPGNREAGLTYARALKGTGDLERAVNEYERVLPRFGGDTSVVREYADVLLEEKDYQKSARYYGIAYNQGLRDDRLLAGYAGSLSGAGKYKAALPYLEELYQRNPTPRVTLELAKLLHRLGRNDRAKELVSQLETSSPQLARSPDF